MARAAGAGLRVPWRTVLPVAAVGALGSVALVLYLAATRDQLVTLVTVLAALYPAIPVVLAVVALRERPGRWQLLGLAGTACAVGLVAAG